VTVLENGENVIVSFGTAGAVTQLTESSPIVESTRADQEKVLDITVEAEIEDNTLVLYVTVRNLLNEPILMRTKPEESTYISFRFKFDNPDSLYAAGLGGSSCPVGLDDEFIALAGQKGRQDRELGREYRFRIPIVEHDFEDVREVLVEIGWFANYFETDSGRTGYLDVDKEVAIVPGNPCIVKPLRQKVERLHMEVVPPPAQQADENTMPVRVEVTPKREGDRLLVEVRVTNTTTDVMLWQVEPVPVKILGERDHAAARILPLRLSPLADYEAGFQAIGWEVFSVWRRKFSVGYVTPQTNRDVTEDVSVRGRYYNATRREWGTVSTRQTVTFEPPDFQGRIKQNATGK
jgi:hypothetical protein